VTFLATPSGPGIDGVIGLSADAPAGFSDLAAAVRPRSHLLIGARAPSDGSVTVTRFSAVGAFVSGRSLSRPAP
jgi:hypothetical protein